MNLLITAGGTRERIDNVRSITNSATGRLGSLIAGEFLRRLPGRDLKLTYLCPRGTVLPDTGDARVTVLTAEGAGEVQTRLFAVLRSGHIDAVVHTMAVSDYFAANATTPEAVADEIERQIARRGTGDLLAIVREALARPEADRRGKMSSDAEQRVLLLKKTPKIIDGIKRESPGSVLVGCKLLSGVDRQTLLDTAYSMLQRAHCDFVLANDTDSMAAGGHDGFLIDADKNVVPLRGKPAIAEAIAEAVLKKLGETK